MFNYPVVLAGASNIDVKVLNEDVNKYEYNLKCYIYKLEDNISDNEAIKRVDDIIVIDNTINLIDNRFNLKYNFYKSNDEYHYLLPVEVKLSGDKTLTVSDSIIKGTNTTSVKGNKIIYFDINPATNINSITFVLSNALADNDYIRIGNLIKLNNYNSDEINTDDYKLIDNINNILLNMKNLDTNNIFNWVYKVPDYNKVVQPTLAKSFWNLNHIYNKYTLPKFNILNLKVDSNMLK